MKKILLVSLLTLSSTAFAHGPNVYYSYGHHHGHNNWVAPLIVGGIVGYAISRPPIVYTQQAYPPVTSIPTVQTQNCTPWIETQNIDGSITRTRTCSN